MMTRTGKITLAFVTAIASLTMATAQAQHSGTNANCTNGGCRIPTGPASYNDNIYPPRPDEFRDTYSRYENDYGSSVRQADWGVGRDYREGGTPTNYWNEDTDRLFRNPITRYNEYRGRLESAVEDSFRSPIGEDYRDGRTRDRLRQDRLEPVRYQDNRDRMRDPFRMPAGNGYSDQFRNAPLSRDRGYGNGYSDGYQTRYRIPLDRIDYTSPRNDSWRDQRPLDSAPRFDERYRAPSERQPRDPRLQDRPGYDPLTPPLPRRGGDSEVEAISNALTARYGNPSTVRAIRSFTSNQALQLYREVNQQTDSRHLEPSSYDLRVRRGLRNVGLALENRAFMQAVGISADSFRLDGFRDTLSRVASQMTVNSLSDAENVVRTVMQQAQNVPGLSPSVVAFEFTSATVDTLDKFSALEPKEPGRGASLDLEQQEITRSAGLETEMVGIGVELKVHDRGLTIMKSLRGGPAAAAGLQAGDLIVGVNRRSIAGLSLANSVDLMKGGEGSSVRLSIERDGRRSSEVTLVRRRFRLYTVNEARILEGTDKVAYLNLSQFGPKSTEELDQALQQLYRQGMKSVIMDLRGNPGGLLNVCVDISNRFLPCGTIVSTRGRLSSDNMLEKASFGRTWSTPLVVLIDKDSASASEIFAAAVQDNRRGVVVGEKSYGKGTVQTHFPLQSISGNLRLTTARFYSPNGKAMSGAGVTPDVLVRDADGPANGDRMLQEAVQIAQSQRLKDIAASARQCRPQTGEVETESKSSFRNDIFDQVAPQTVLR